MSDPFIGEIMMAGFNFAPADYSKCHGQSMAISQFSALYSLIGTQFGGNGRTDFALPDLRGRAPLHTGAGVPVGTLYGWEAISLTISNTGHNHAFFGSANDGTIHIPFNPATGDGNIPAQIPAADTPAYHTATNLNAIGVTSIESAGAGQPHDNMQPYLVLTFCIAMSGLYPSRN